MEPCVKEQSQGNYFDIAPLLREHEKKLRRESVLLTIRLESSSGRKKQQDTKREQKHWEQLKGSILDAQLGGAFSYSLPNLEQIKQVVLFTESAGQSTLNKRSSFSEVRSAFPKDPMSHADEEVDEGFRTPASAYPSGNASGYASPQSQTSWAEPGTSGRPSALPLPSSPAGLVERWRSPDQSPKSRVGSIGFKEKVKAVKRKRLVQSPSRITEAESRSQSPARQRQAGASSEGTSHRRHHRYHHYEQGQQDQPGTQEEEESADSNRAAATLEEMYASLDRLTRIISEMALLISVSTAHSEKLDEGHHRRPSSPAAVRRSGRSRSISRHHGHSSRERSASATPSPLGSPAPPDRKSSRSAGRVSSRDTAFFPLSDDEEGRESRRKRGKRPKPQRRQKHRSVAETCAVPVLRRASDQEVVIQSGPAVNSRAPSNSDSANGSEDVSSYSSRSGSYTEISVSQEEESGVEEGNRVIAEDSRPAASSRPTSVRSDDERTLLSSQTRSPGLFYEHPPFLPQDALPPDQGAFEAASLQEDEDGGRLSPGEVPFASEGPMPFAEPTFPVLEVQTKGQDRGFRGIARGSCWSDPGHIWSELLNAEDVDDGVDEFPLFRRADVRLPHGGIPIEQGARDDDTSQHIWRWANSETDRVVDEAAMRRLELFQTTYGGNIDGQPPRMKAANLRLASTPKRVGQRMCQVQVVCIITPIAQETNSEPTSTVRMQAARTPSLPERKAQ